MNELDELELDVLANVEELLSELEDELDDDEDVSEASVLLLELLDERINVEELLADDELELLL